ncbi:MAG: hypothetical protein QF541_05575 [Lentisphaeria bacterium]|jgi:hypothetical protein|nr:hypothetical protein [Lentisphaeria bacterium]
MLDKLWCGRGGFIAGYYGANVPIGVGPKWQDYACDELIRVGISANCLNEDRPVNPRFEATLGSAPQPRRQL